MKTVNDGIRVVNRAEHFYKGLSNEQIAELNNGDSAPLMLEPVTIEEIEHTYLLDAVTAPEMLLSAITTKRQRLDRTMQAFLKSLRQAMQGTNIAAGVQLTDLEDGGTKQTLVDPIISKPRKAGLVAVITAQFPFSDGQTVSVLLYAPDDDPLKITADDTLIAFRFLLNKRDITHIVSPNNGRDISLKQTTMAIANAVERNHAKFVANKGKANEEKKTLEEKQATLQSLTDNVEDIEGKVSSNQAEAKASDDEIAKLDLRIEKQKRVVSGLEVELAGIEAQKQAGEPPVALKDQLLSIGKEMVAFRDQYESRVAMPDHFIAQLGEVKQAAKAEGDNETATVIGYARASRFIDTALTELINGGLLPLSMDKPTKPGNQNSSSASTVPLSSIKTDSLLNPAIKVTATNKDNPDLIWYSQGEPKTMAVGGLNTPEEIASVHAYRDTIKAAKEKGFELERYKHSRLQGIYILVNGNEEVLTQKGFDALAKELPATPKAGGVGEVLAGNFGEAAFQKNLAVRDRETIERLRAAGYDFGLDETVGYWMTKPDSDRQEFGTMYDNFITPVNEELKKLLIADLDNSNTNPPNQAAREFNEWNVPGTPTNGNSFNKLKKDSLDDGTYVISYDNKDIITVQRTEEGVEVSVSIDSGLYTNKAVYTSITEAKRLGVDLYSQAKADHTYNLFSNAYTQEELDRANGKNVAAISGGRDTSEPTKPEVIELTNAEAQGQFNQLRNVGFGIKLVTGEQLISFPPEMNKPHGFKRTIKDADDAIYVIDDIYGDHYSDAVEHIVKVRLGTLQGLTSSTLYTEEGKPVTIELNSDISPNNYLGGWILGGEKRHMTIEVNLSGEGGQFSVTPKKQEPFTANSFEEIVSTLGMRNSWSREKPEQPTYDTGALSAHLGTLKAIAAGDVPTNPASEQLRDITTFLTESDLLDEHGAELEAAVDAVSRAIKEQFEEVA